MLLPLPQGYSITVGNRSVFRHRLLPEASASSCIAGSVAPPMLRRNKTGLELESFQWLPLICSTAHSCCPSHILHCCVHDTITPRGNTYKSSQGTCASDSEMLSSGDHYRSDPVQVQSQSVFSVGRRGLGGWCLQELSRFWRARKSGERAPLASERMLRAVVAAPMGGRVKAGDK